MEISILGFLLMLGAALLGFSIAWLQQKLKWQPVKELQEKKQRAYLRLRDEYDMLVKHSNSLQSEKMKFQSNIDALNKQSRLQKEYNVQLEQEKEFIFKEFDSYRNEVNEKLISSKKVLEAFEDLKEKNQKVKLKTDKWRIKYHEVLESLQEAESISRILKKERDHLQEKLNNSKPETNSVFEWESNYKELKLRYLALAKEKKDLDQKVKTFEIEMREQKVKESEFNKVQLQLDQLEKEKNELVKLLEKVAQRPPQNEKEAILSRIGRKKDKVDFGRIGKASPKQKDNLQLIKGIGPFIEQKLNALGIFHFQQIAHFKEEDISEINDIIELAPGHISMDDWVGQALRMK